MNLNKFPNCVKNSKTNYNFNNTNIQNLIKHDALPLVFIEHASEMIKTCILHDGVFLERVLSFISNSSKIGKVKSIGVISFNENRNNVISAIQVNRKYDYIIGLLEKDLGEYGGHFGSVIFDIKNNIAEVFDSMQIKNKSNHTESFRIFTSKLLNIPLSNVVSYSCGCSHRDSCQPTGGFLPTTKRKGVIQIQDPESQHHFCYMEGLLHLAETVLNINNKVPSYKRPIATDKGTELRIFAIKRWIYALVHKFPSENLKNKIFKEFLQNYFTKVWFSDDIIYSVKNGLWVKRTKVFKPKFKVVQISNIDKANSKESLLDIVKFTHNI